MDGYLTIHVSIGTRINRIEHDTGICREVRNNKSIKHPLLARLPAYRHLALYNSYLDTPTSWDPWEDLFAGYIHRSCDTNQ